MITSPRGLHFTSLSVIFADYEAHHDTPSTELDLTIPEDQVQHARVKRQILDFLDDGFEIRVDVATRSDAHVSSERDPKVIWVRSELVESAGLARMCQHMPMGMDSYFRQYFYLAAALVRAIQQLLRAQLVNNQARNPSERREVDHPAQTLRYRGEEWERGEGGSWFEKRFYGGIIEGSVNDGWTNEIKVVIVQRTDPDEWFHLGVEVMRRICQGRPGWEDELPFQPRSGQQILAGLNTQMRLRDAPGTYTLSAPGDVHPDYVLRSEFASERSGCRSRDLADDWPR